MERLTIDEIIEHCDRKTGMYEKACDVKYLETAFMGNGIKEYWEHKQVAVYLRKIKAYEDAEDQGLILRLPCKVGTIIYQIENNTDACCKCKDFKISYCDDDLCGNKNGHDEGGVFYVLNPQYADKPLCKKQFYEIEEYEMKTIDEIFWRRNDFGKTAFFTRKEAEAKLAEMEGVE